MSSYKVSFLEVNNNLKTNIGVDFALTHVAMGDGLLFHVQVAILIIKSYN